MHRQHQHPPTGSPPPAVWLQQTSRVVIPAPANDNARSAIAGATALAIAATLLVIVGWVVLRMLG